MAYPGWWAGMGDTGRQLTVIRTVEPELNDWRMWRGCAAGHRRNAFGPWHPTIHPFIHPSIRMPIPASHSVFDTVPSHIFPLLSTLARAVSRVHKSCIRVSFIRRRPVCRFFPTISPARWHVGYLRFRTSAFEGVKICGTRLHRCLAISSALQKTTAAWIWTPPHRKQLPYYIYRHVGSVAFLKLWWTVIPN